MDFPRIVAGGSIDIQETPKSKKKERSYNRHTPCQIAKLEQQRIFKECPYPDDDQRRRLGEELGLEPRKVKFWFQNKRTQVKTLIERSGNNALRFENEKIQSENFTLRDTLKNIICSSCQGPNSEEEGRALNSKNLRLENALLLQEHERLSKLMWQNNRNPVLPPTLQTSYDPLQGSSLNQKSKITAPDENIPAPGTHILAIDHHVLTHTPTHDQHIIDPAPTPVLHEDIYMPIPTFDHNFSVISPTPDQNVPALTYATTPAVHHNFSHMIPATDQNILPCPITPSLDQNFPPISTPVTNKNYCAIDQNFSSTTLTLGQNIPDFTYPLDQDILMQDSTIDQLIHALEHNIDANTLTLDQDIPVLSPADLDQHIPTLDQDIHAPAIDFGVALGVPDGCMLPHPISTTIDMEKALTMEFANNAMEELKRLLSMNEPYWFNSTVDGKFILHRETYEKMYHKSNSLKGPHARIESSKDSRIVSMSGAHLVDMFLNSDKWVDLFPTIVKNAQTMQVFDNGSLGTRNGTLQLMNAEMHILSPLVPIRHFFFLRYCKQIEAGEWVIADVSLDSSPYNTTPPRTWRFPSGCMIHEITNESCRVSWVEHVEVDDNIQIDPLYREIICLNNAYGAERWVLTLERMCERFTSASLECLPSSDAGGVISSAKGRRSVMKLAHRMVKMFCGTLGMADNMDFPKLNKLNNGGIRVSIRKSTNSNVQEGMIVSAATSFWLPVSAQNVFDFLKDNSNRLQWDVLCNANPVCEIQHITNGTNPENFTSIIRPFVPKENDMLILQESYTHSLESLLVYAPIDIATLGFVMKGEDSSLLPLLPSGFIISRDGRPNASAEHSEGSLVTMAYQVLVGSPSAVDKLDVDSVASVNTLLTTTVEKIKAVLNCSNLDN